MFYFTVKAHLQITFWKSLSQTTRPPRLIILFLFRNYLYVLIPWIDAGSIIYKAIILWINFSFICLFVRIFCLISKTVTGVDGIFIIRYLIKFGWKFGPNCSRCRDNKQHFSYLPHFFVRRVTKQIYKGSMNGRVGRGRPRRTFGRK